MATKTWVGGGTTSPTDWTEADNWSPTGAPGSTDSVIIDTTSSSPTLSASVTINTLTIGGSDTLTVVNAGVTATNGIFLTGSGGISGYGGFRTALTTSATFVPVTASGPATLTASGGDLAFSPSINDAGDALTLLISGATDEIEIDNGGTAHAVNFNGASGELSVEGTLTVDTQITVGSGFIRIFQGELDDTFGLVLNGGTVSGTSGAVIGGPITGTGTLGGELEIKSDIAANAGPIYQMGFITLDGTVGTGNTFEMVGPFSSNGPAHRLFLADDVAFGGTIDGMQLGFEQGITPFTAVDIQNKVVTVASATGTDTTSGTVTLSDGAVLNLTNIAQTNWVAKTVQDQRGTGTNVYLDVGPACFCRGTRIRTWNGEVAVEELEIGDRVMTKSGVARPVKWIGRRSYDGRFIRGNRWILPVCIKAGAISEGLPARDLWVSPEHGLYLVDALVPARLLVNGMTIVQPDAVDRVDYFHLEFAAHEIIFAERMAAESYVERDNRAMFHNAADFARLYPDEGPGRGEFCARRVETEGPELAAIRAGLAAHAAAQGYRLTDDPDLHLVVDGAIIRPQSVADRVFSFSLPPDSAAVWLASRSAIPAEMVVLSDDGRRLGAPIDRMVLKGDGLCLDIGHGHPGLCDGFHDDEEWCRWTDGMAQLPKELLSIFTGAVSLEIHLIESELRYPLEPAEGTAGLRRRPRGGAAPVGRMRGVDNGSGFRRGADYG